MRCAHPRCPPSGSSCPWIAPAAAAWPPQPGIFSPRPRLTHRRRQAGPTRRAARTRMSPSCPTALAASASSPAADCSAGGRTAGRPGSHGSSERSWAGAPRPRRGWTRRLRGRAPGNERSRSVLSFTVTPGGDQLAHPRERSDSDENEAAAPQSAMV